MVDTVEKWEQYTGGLRVVEVALEHLVAACEDLALDAVRLTNKERRNTRRHLGSGLYVCDECGNPVRTKPQAAQR